MKRRAWVCLLGLLIPTLVAEAHAGLVKAIPEPGSVVAGGITEIRLTFDEAIEEGSSITLYAEGFQAVPGVEAQLDGREMVASMLAALQPGKYTVQWVAVGDDGHTSQGSYQFNVAENAGRPTWLWWLLTVPLAVGAYSLWRRSRPPRGD